MNILCLQSSSDLYGSDRQLLNFIKQCPDVNFFVWVSYDGPLVQELEKIGTEVFIKHLAILRRKYFTPIGMLKISLQFWYDLVQIKQFCQSYQIDIIYSNTTAVASGSLAARFSKVPHIQHVREIITSPKIFGRILSLLCSLSTQVICVSNETKRYFINYLPPLSSKCITVYDGLDFSKYENGDRNKFRANLGIDNDNVLIGMIGRILPWKGQGFFLKGAVSFLKQFPHQNVHFLLVGSAFRGQEWREAQLVSQVAESGYPKKITAMPFRNDVPDVLAALDIFILPSTKPDPLPNVVLEAMSAGKPVIANGHGGVLEMVENNKTGFLITPNSIEELVRMLQVLVNDRTLRDLMGTEGKRKVVSLFGLDRFGREMKEQLLSTARSKRN